TKDSLSLNYVGNHGYDLAAENAGLNAFCDALTPTPTGSCLASLGATSFVGLPAAIPDPRSALTPKLATTVSRTTTDWPPPTPAVSPTASRCRPPSPGVTLWTTYPMADSFPSTTEPMRAFCSRRIPTASSVTTTAMRTTMSASSSMP